MDSRQLDDLAMRARSGDRLAFHDLMRETMQEVRLFIAARAYSLELVEEVLQATYVACFESLARYEPRQTLLPWIKGIAYNRLRRELDSRSRHAHVDGLERLLAGESARQIDDAAGPDEAVLASLRRCLERLGPQARELLELRHAQDVSIDALASRFARTRSAIASMLKRIRLTVRSCMEPVAVGQPQP